MKFSLYKNKHEGGVRKKQFMSFLAKHCSNCLRINQQQIKGNSVSMIKRKIVKQGEGIMQPQACCLNGCMITNAGNGCSVAEGVSTTASGFASHVEGFLPLASECT